MYFLNPYENIYTYSLVEFSRILMTPYRFVIKTGIKSNSLANQLLFKNSNLFNRFSLAYLELAERITRQYSKPTFNITEVLLNDKIIGIEEKIALKLPFCNLVNFKKNEKLNQPKLLIVAPLSGHFSTLLRGTVQDTLPFFDVYITDWINARDVPMSAGSFDLEDYINYCIKFISYLKGNCHVMAVCQPSVPVVAAVSLMSEDSSAYIPKSMILIGGPIDTRNSPTEVNNFANSKKMNWFENNMISRVPINYKGFMRPVYPGFLQLAGFMAMNMKKHVGEHIKLFNHLVEGDGDSSAVHKKFYDEYLSVMDLPAEFYLQTVQAVFKDHSLPENKMMVNGRIVSLKNIKKAALLVIEGEKDDITGIGQTKAAIELCSNIPKNKKFYHFQKNVGHYGLFNGTRFREQIVPVIKDFCYKYEH